MVWVDWLSRGEEGVLCIRVLTISRGCTIRVAIDPAESPAAISTSAGVGPTCLDSVIETLKLGLVLYMVTGSVLGVVCEFAPPEVGRRLRMRSMTTGFLQLKNVGRLGFRGPKQPEQALATATATLEEVPLFRNITSNEIPCPNKCCRSSGSCSLLYYTVMVVSLASRWLPTASIPSDPRIPAYVHLPVNSLCHLETQ